MTDSDVIRADHPSVRRSAVDWHRPPDQPRESDSARTERVLALQDAWAANHADATAEPWSPEAVAADLLRDPSVRQSAFGFALANHGAPVCEARGPADPPGPLEREYIRRERRAVVRAELDMSPPGHPSRQAWEAAGVPADAIPADAPDIRRPVSPF